MTQTNYGDIGVKRAVVSCVLKHQDKYLLLQRNRDPRMGNYVPVGGKLEPFETPDEAAKRETFEEIGVKVDNFKLRWIMTETSPVKCNFINYIYVAEVDYFVPNECNEGILERIEESKLKTIPTPQTDLLIYEYLSKNTFFVFDALYDEEVTLLSLIEKITGKILYEKK